MTSRSLSELLRELEEADVKLPAGDYRDYYLVRDLKPLGRIYTAVCATSGRGIVTKPEHYEPTRVTIRVDGKDKLLYAITQDRDLWT